MHIGIDLRGLNYNLATGINNYTTKILENLPAKHTYTGIGISQSPQLRLLQHVPRTRGFNFITLREYFGSFLHSSQQISTGLSIAAMRFGSSGFSCQRFDCLIMPQPKPLLVHPKTPVILYMHDCYGIQNPQYSGFKQRIIESYFVYQNLLSQARFIIANSHSTAQDLVSLFKVQKDKIKLVYPGPLVVPKPESKELINCRFFLAISGIEPRKNWLNIIRAWKLLYKKYSTCKLILIGKPVDKKYFKEVQNKCNNTPGIQLHINCDNKQKSWYLKHCYALLYPSLYEGFGFPILEAFHYQKPVITSNISSMPEIAGPGGVYVNPFSITDIAAAMEMLLIDKSYYKKISQNTITQYKKFSWESSSTSLSKYLQEITQLESKGN